MEWKDITVGQFMNLSKLAVEKIEDQDKAEQAVSIIYDKTPQEIDEMPAIEFNRLAAEAGRFLTEKIPGKVVKKISTPENEYAIVYDPKKLKHRQYVEILHFGEKPIHNMNLLLASIVRPIRKVKGKAIEVDNNVLEHEQIAEDLLNAPVCDVYHACVFFCKLYKSLISSSRDFLIPEMMKTGMTKEKADTLIMDSISAMDGFTRLSE